EYVWSASPLPGRLPVQPALTRQRRPGLRQCRALRRGVRPRLPALRGQPPRPGRVDLGTDPLLDQPGDGHQEELDGQGHPDPGLHRRRHDGDHPGRDRELHRPGRDALRPVLQYHLPVDRRLRRHDRPGDALRRPAGERAVALLLPADHPAGLCPVQAARDGAADPDRLVRSGLRPLARAEPVGRCAAGRAGRQPRRSRADRGRRDADRLLPRGRRPDDRLVHRPQGDRRRRHDRRVPRAGDAGEHAAAGRAAALGEPRHPDESVQHDLRLPHPAVPRRPDQRHREPGHRLLVQPLPGRGLHRVPRRDGHRRDRRDPLPLPARAL
ncbi:MAG: hypothetical protein AVDCRST_MAG33-1035, partial [uncultured Thermomicrobiales bacterium]